MGEVKSEYKGPGHTKVKDPEAKECAYSERGTDNEATSEGMMGHHETKPFRAERVTSGEILLFYDFYSYCHYLNFAAQLNTSASFETKLLKFAYSRRFPQMISIFC